MVAKRQPRVLKKDTHLRRALCLSQDKPKAQLQVGMCPFWIEVPRGIAAKTWIGRLLLYFAILLEAATTHQGTKTYGSLTSGGGCERKVKGRHMMFTGDDTVKTTLRGPVLESS